MRQLFSWRFVAAIAALGVLALLTQALLANDNSIVSVIAPPPIERQIDVIAKIESAAQSGNVGLGPTGMSTGYLDLQLTGGPAVRIAPGTLGEVSCDELDGTNQCALFADTLGDAVVWFAILPVTGGTTVELPPIVDLDSGDAVFENGWRIPYAETIERRCDGQDIVSFSDFLKRFGPDSVTIVDLATRQVTAVRCGTESAP